MQKNPYERVFYHNYLGLKLTYLYLIGYGLAVHPNKKASWK